MSNLLDKASIILTPTAYNNGEALCVKPSDGSGDFDFSRNSAATRVNAQGLVENVQILSSNLVQNGDFSEEGVEEVSNGSFSQEGVELVTNGNFDTDSDWQLTQATISNGAATFVTTDGSFAGIRQTVFTIGKTYLISLEVSNLIGTAEVNTNGGTSIGLDITSNGTKSFYMVAENADIEIKRKLGITNVSATIDNVSVREVGQDWTLGTGWSIAEDKAVAVSGTASKLRQTNTLNGKTCKVTLTVSDYSSGLLQVDFGSTSSASIIANGDYVFYGTYDQNNFEIYKSSDFNGSITNISVKEVGQNWVLGTGWDVSVGSANKTGSANSELYQTGVGIQTGKKYKFTYEITSYTSGGIQARLFSSTSTSGAFGVVRTAVGVYEEILTGVLSNGNAGFVTLAGFNGSITNISVIEITDDTNLPRINYEGFSYQDALGSEEIVNGGFDTNLNNWTDYGGTTISWESGGFALLDNDNGYWCKIRQSDVFEIGKTYRVILTAKSNIANKLFFSSTITGSFSQADTFETFEQYYTATTTDF